MYAATANAGIVNLGGRTLVFDNLMTAAAALDLRLYAYNIRACLEIAGRLGLQPVSGSRHGGEHE